MKQTYEFRSMAEVELFELKDPDVLKTDPVANKAAREVFEAALTNARKRFTRISQETIESMSISQIDENLTEILGIEDWLEKHPAWNTTKTKDAVCEGLKAKLVHAKGMLSIQLHAIPGSITFNAANKSIIAIAKIEQALGVHAEI